MLRYVIFAITTMTLAVVTGCATSTKDGDAASTAKSAGGSMAASAVQPDWLTGESREYPRQKYLTAHGTGGNADEAIGDAQKKLTALFEVDNTEASFTPLTLPVPGLNQELAALQKDINVATVWRNSGTGRYHALAFAPRKPAETYLQRKVNEIDTTTGQTLDQAKTAKDDIAKLGLLARALHLQSTRNQLQASLQQADLTGKGVAPRWREKKLNANASKQLKRLKIMPVGHDKYPLIDSLTSGLATAGVSSAKEKNAEYLIRATLTISVSLPKSGQTQGQGNLQLALVDKASGSSVGTRQWAITVDAQDAIAAERHVLEQADFFIKKDMENFLLDVAMQNP